MNNQTQGTQVERLKRSIEELAQERDYFEKLFNKYYDLYKQVEGKNENQNNS